MTIQITQVACEGFALAVKIAHPLTDISSLVHFMRSYASNSRSQISGVLQPMATPVFDTEQLDACAAGGINADGMDESLVGQARNLPLHRYDWWLSTADCSWPVKIPDVFDSGSVIPTGEPMPWPQWDIAAPDRSLVEDSK